MKKIGLLILLFAVTFSGYCSVKATPKQLIEILKLYNNPNPAFEISIPEYLYDWEMIEQDRNDSPIYFVKKGSNGLPFISTMIDFYDDASLEAQQNWANADKIFRSKATSDMLFELRYIPDLRFTRNERITIAGLPAFDRVCISEETKITYRTIYILFPKAMVGFALNAWTDSFEKDDKDFLSIIKTLKVKEQFK